jgi:hypothetical protein
MALNLLENDYLMVAGEREEGPREALERRAEGRKHSKNIRYIIIYNTRLLELRGRRDPSYMYCAQFAQGVRHSP